MIPRYTKAEMANIWSDDNKFKLWLEIETLAMEAMVEQGTVPKEALEEVKAKGNFNTQRVLEIEAEVKHDVIAFLTNVAEYVGEPARYLHLGMTSSDLLDTTFAVQLKQSTELIIGELKELISAIKKRAYEGKDVVCVGRSHGIHAEPTTIGLKLATWYAELARGLKRLELALEDISVGAISGPVGTYAHLSPEVEEFVCEKLGLKSESISTQIIPRDRHAFLFSIMGQIGSSLERISVEIRHLQRTEVREIEEPFTKGQKGSSAMPHKRNPVLTENITGLARLMRSWAGASLENIVLWHERDISHSSAERVIAPDMTIALHFAICRLKGVVENMVIYPENMQKNMDLTRGLVFSGALLVALAEKGLSREDAYKLVQENALASWDVLNDLSEGDDFPTRVRANEQITSLLSKEELDEVLSMKRHTKHVDYIFKKVFESE